MITGFSVVMLALGAILLAAALVYIVGFVVSAIVGAGYATVESAVHHGHHDSAHAA